MNVGNVVNECGECENGLKEQYANELEFLPRH